MQIAMEESGGGGERARCHWGDGMAGNVGGVKTSSIFTWLCFYSSISELILLQPNPSQLQPLSLHFLLFTYTINCILQLNPYLIFH